MESYMAIKSSIYNMWQMEELWKSHPKWKKPVINDHILFASMYIKCPQ